MRAPTTPSAPGWSSARTSVLRHTLLAPLRGRNVLVPTAYGLASMAVFVMVGVPYQRDLLAIWLLLGLLCFSLSDVRGWARGVILEWLPFIGLLIAYDSLRGSAGHVFGVHYLPQIDVDRSLFGGVPIVRLQHWLWTGNAVWWAVRFGGVDR